MLLRRVSQLSLAVAVLSLVSVSAFAKPGAKDSFSVTIDLLSPDSVGTTTVAPGEYRVVIQDNSAKFQKDGKTVAEVPCTLKTLPTKAHETVVSIDHNQMTEIKVSGKVQAVEFSATTASGN